MKVKEIVKLIEEDGWYFYKQKGSHMQFKHDKKPGKVTIPNHGWNIDLPKGTEISILKQANLK